MEVKKMLPALPNNNNNSQNTENEPVKHDNVSGKQNIKDNSSKDEPKSEKTNKSSGSENKLFEIGWETIKLFF